MFITTRLSHGGNTLAAAVFSLVFCSRLFSEIKMVFCVLSAALSKAIKEQIRPASHMDDLTQFMLPHSAAAFLSVCVAGSCCERNNHFITGVKVGKG